jgi:hypothetical protein
MSNEREELVQILERFAQSGWELIATPAAAWLAVQDDTAAAGRIAPQLTSAIEQAESECGSCGCELDPLYKQALALKHLLAG